MSDIGSVLGRTDWQMALSERIVLEGLLSQLSPALAIEIGTAQGGSLSSIARHSAEVHTFDLGAEVDRAAYPNVTFHEGDNHELLPQVLAGFEREGRNVDFALVDGDHSAAGVRRDVEDLLGSGALRASFVVMHDTMNEEVLDGLTAIDYAAFPHVVFVDLAFSQLHQRPRRMLEEVYGGLGLIVVDADGTTGVIPERRDRGRSAAALAWPVFGPVRRLRRHVGRRVLSKRG